MKTLIVKFTLIFCSALFVFSAYQSYLENSHTQFFFQLGLGFLLLRDAQTPEFFLQKIQAKTFFSVQKIQIDFNPSGLLWILGYSFLAISIVLWTLSFIGYKE